MIKRSMKVVYGVGGQYKFSGFKFIAFLKVPPHLHNECKISPQQAKCVAHSWIILTVYVTVVWYFYGWFKVTIYDNVRQLLRAIKQKSEAREKCACLLCCMPLSYASTSLWLYCWHCAFLGFSRLRLKFQCIYFPFVATRVGPISSWFR